MTFDSRTFADAQAQRTAQLLAHFDGMLDVRTLDAFQGVWTKLEHAAADDAAHARAVRERLFWDSLAHAGSLAAQPSQAAAEVLAPVQPELEEPTVLHPRAVEPAPSDDLWQGDEELRAA